MPLALHRQGLIIDAIVYPDDAGFYGNDFVMLLLADCLVFALFVRWCNAKGIAPYLLGRITPSQIL